MRGRSDAGRVRRPDTAAREPLRLFALYDAWNRLVEVNKAGSLTAGDFNGNGQIAPAQGSGHVIGDLIMQMAYDGLGRLIQVRRPLPLGEATTPPVLFFQIESYYYDGVRRLQTVIGTETLVGITWETEREYIYGPGYVDEFVAQIADPDGSSRLMYMLQDANYNVMALLSNPATGQAPTVLAEYTYEPYGDRVYAHEDGLPPKTWNTVGHQGLFFYAFTADGSPMVSATPGLYFSRGRWYNPRFGRFQQQDSLATALVLNTALQRNGQSARIALAAFSAASHYSDGLNLYQYERSNPVRNRDPSGCSLFMDSI